MNTPEQYIENKIPVIPCKRNTRIPIGSDWQHKPIDINRFNPGDNIGWHLLEQTDIDIDNPICHKFLDVIKTRCCAVYGRKSNPESHLIFPEKNEYKKWTMHNDFAPWFNKFRKKSTILEVRSGQGFQSIAPGSIIDNEEVRWDRYEELKQYPGKLINDIELVVFATMLSIVYAPKGARGDFCYAIACLLAKWGKWSADKIDVFILNLAEKSNDENFRNKKGKGTHAHKQLSKPDGRIKGLPALMGILKVSAEAIKDIFSVVHINIGEEKTQKLKMYDWGEYLNLDIPEPKFIVERLFKTKSINFISGPKGNGKTEWILGLTDIISKTGDFLNYKVNEPIPVIYIDGEMDEYDLIDRRVAYTQKIAPRPYYFNIIHYAQQVDQTIPDIKFELGQKLILECINEVKEKTGKTPVLVLDNLRSLSNYKENDSDDWRPIGVWLKNLRALDVVSIVIDHHGKNTDGGPRGSSSKTDWANVSIFIKKVETGRTKGKMRMEIKFDKARGLKPDETQEYECEYDYNGNWEIVASEKKVSEEEYLEKIYQIKNADHWRYIEKKKKIQKQLEKKQITEKIYNQLERALRKTEFTTQLDIANQLGISAGKVNQLIKGPYESFFIKKCADEYKAKEVMKEKEKGMPEELKKKMEQWEKSHKVEEGEEDIPDLPNNF